MYVVINAFFFIAKYTEIVNVYVFKTSRLFGFSYNYLITKIDLCSDNVSLTKGITVLDAVLWIDISWKETKDSTIINCFRIAGFPVVLIIKPELFFFSVS
jgi:hypothetical protein